jgi:hypothetical protein
VAQAKLAYKLFTDRFSVDRWQQLGRHVESFLGEAVKVSELGRQQVTSAFEP